MMTFADFIEKTDKEIERLRKEGRTKLYAFSVEVDSIEPVKAYYTSNKYVIECYRCPKGLYDIFIYF